MTSTQSHAKKRPTKQTEAQKREATAMANRRAQLQWYALGAAFAITTIVVVVLLTIYTEGELPIYTHGG